LSVVGIVALTAAFSSFASDSDRIAQLEKEVLELKLRLTNLETPQKKSGINQRMAASNDGWKSLANWRSLKKGMSYDDVRGVLGEPATIRASGVLTFWGYANRGTVTYFDDRLDGWSEPR
jgi:hypothetical protein